MAADIIHKLTSYSKFYGVVNIEGYRIGSTRFANSEISQNTNMSDLKVSLTLHDGKKEATCTTNILGDAGLKKLAQDTESLLSVVAAGDFDIIPWRRPPMKEPKNDKDLEVIYNAGGRAEAIREGVANLTDGYRAAGAIVLEKKIAAYGNSESQKNEILFADLNNIQFNTVVTNTITNAEGSGECLSHKFGAINIKEAFLQAKERCALGAYPLSLDSGEHTVILSPQAVGDLVSYITWSLNAKRVIEGLSFCDGNLTQTPTFGKNITIHDDVDDPRTFFWYFDYEGNNRRFLPLVEKGVVKNLLFDNKTANIMRAGQTGHAVSNKGSGGFSLHTVMQGGDSSLDEMINSIDKGLFISELHYTNFVSTRALQVTGLTRNGTFLIERGKIAGAVKTMRFNQNLFSAFNNISALSKDLTVVNAGGWAAVMPAVKTKLKLH